MSAIRQIEIVTGVLVIGAGLGWWVHPGAGVLAVGAGLVLDACGMDVLKWWASRRG